MMTTCVADADAFFGKCGEWSLSWAQDLIARCSRRASTQTIPAAKDAYVWSAAPTNNIGATTTAEVGRTVPKSGPPLLKRALLHFDLSGLPSDAIVTTATLRLYVERTSGDRATHAITVGSLATVPALSLTAEPTAALAPAAVTFQYALDPSHALVQLAIDFNGDSIDDYSSTTAPAALSTSYPAAGVYLVRLRVTDDQSVQHEAFVSVPVRDSAAVDALLRALWGDMTAALDAQDTGTALTYLTPAGQAKYARVFDALATGMPDIVASFSPLQQVTLSSDVGEYAVNRMIGSRDRVFLIYFLRDGDGVWRIDSM